MPDVSRRTRSRALFAGIAVLVALGAGAPAPARADFVAFDVILQGSQEAPTPVVTTARGFARVVFDDQTRRLDWILIHTVVNPTLAHFHGSPTGFPGVAAPIEIIIGDTPGSLVSPIVGTATVDPADVTDLLNGRWYINVHSGNCPTCPAGEVRGQMPARGAPAPVVIYPPSGDLGQTQGLNVGIFVTPPAGETVTGGTFRFDGADVTGAFVGCLRAGTPAQGGLLLLCDVPGGVLPVGEHFFDARLTFSGGSTAGTTAVWNALANTEP